MNIIEKALSDDVRRTLILFYFDDMSTKEIAEALKIPQGSVLRRLNFARNKIKKEVEKYEKENNTKLFSMAIPFLSKLFIKEAEQVAIKPMPVKLANLSASVKASGKDAGMKASKEALKKGTEIMNTKILIGGVAGVVAVGATVGIFLSVMNNTPDTVQPEETVIEETGASRIKNDTGLVSNEETGESDGTVNTGETEETKETKPSAELTEDSIIIHMDGMTADEIVDNVWKTSNISVGMSKEDYEALFYIPDDQTLAGTRYNSPDDTFYWLFYGTADVRISQLQVNVSVDDNGKVNYTDKGTFSTVYVNFKDEEFNAEVFERFIEKYESLGYTISDDSGDSMPSARIVKLERDDIKVTIQNHKSFIVVYIPLSDSN